MFFSVITKNLNWEILFLKDGTGLRMKNFNVIGTRRNCLKVVGGGGVAWAFCRIREGGSVKKIGVVFEGG